MNPVKHCRTTSNSRDTQPAKSPPRLKLKKMSYIYSIDYFSIPKKLPLKLGIMTPATGMWPGRSRTKGSQSGKGRWWYMRYLPGKIKRHRRQQIYNPKRDSENSKSKQRVPETKKNWRVWNELGGRYIHRQEICIYNRIIHKDYPLLPIFLPSTYTQVHISNLYKKKLLSLRENSQNDLLLSFFCVTEVYLR